MTPLALKTIKAVIAGSRNHLLLQMAGVVEFLPDMHCFECTQIAPLIDDLAKDIHDNARSGDASKLHHVVGDLGFLPAPRTWIEWAEDDGTVGFLLVEEQYTARVFHVFTRKKKGDDKFVGAHCGALVMPIQGAPLHVVDVFSFGWTDPYGSPISESSHLYYMTKLFAALALINTPRVIGRRQHMPHRAIERELLKARNVTGKFPLNAWTEIRLEVRPPKEMEGMGQHEAHLTGQKALHFCRKHIRIRFGKVEIVSSHWRGDPALGIKQSRYTLVPPELPDPS